MAAHTDHLYEVRLRTDMTSEEWADLIEEVSGAYDVRVIRVIPLLDDSGIHTGDYIEDDTHALE